MTAPATSRAALYLRVSTGKQARQDLSIPDQRREAEVYCLAKGWSVVAEYLEPGASATDNRRPEFQRMMEGASAKPPPFDVIVVHSFSRFFRDHFELEFYVRKLGKNGIRLVSKTQQVGEDPMSVMMRQIMTLFDEYQSRENAKHTLRAMKENARQGFWNGSLPPLGYRVVAAEQRGAKIKKRLEIDPVSGETVRLIFSLARRGDGRSGPMGLKAIAAWLNIEGIRTRNGGRWAVGSVHRILKNTTYVGRHLFNTHEAKSGKRKSQGEIIEVAVPSLIEMAEFDSVQQKLKARRPKVTSPRIVDGPNLLTSLARCAHCGGAMTLRTGKSSRYRYYSCSTAARQGPIGCIGQAVKMSLLDAAVLEHIAQRLLNPGRLETIVVHLLRRRQASAGKREERLAGNRRRATEIDAKLTRLYQAIEAGLADLSIPASKTGCWS